MREGIDQGDALGSARTPWLARKAQTDGSMANQGRPSGGLGFPQFEK
jgi:hypothetical protein